MDDFQEWGMIFTILTLCFLTWQQSKTLKAYRKRNMDLECENSVLKSQLDELFSKMEK